MGVEDETRLCFVGQIALQKLVPLASHSTSYHVLLADDENLRS